MLVIAFEATILFTIVLWKPTFRALVYFPLLLRVQLLLHPCIFHLLLLRALLMLIYCESISFLAYARWILLGIFVNHSTMHANGWRDVRSVVRLLLLECILLSLVPLVEALFEFCLLDNIFVPDLNEHHVNGIVLYTTVRTFVAWDILEIQPVNYLAVVALPAFATLKLLLLLLLLL